MRKRRTNRDENVEAILRGDEPTSDLAGVAAFVGELRATYHEGSDLVRTPELEAFMEAPALEAQAVLQPTWRQRLERRRIRMLSGLSGFLATVTGKVVLTGAVAAASVGGLHAGDVVDVPGLPDNDPTAVEQAENGNDADGQNDDLPDDAVEGQQTAEEKQAAAEAYTTAVRDWTDCVSENAAAQGDETTSTTGEFDPRSECDDRPTPQDFGLTEVPDQADQEGVENGEEGRENVPDDPATQGEDDPTGNSERGDDAPESTGNDDNGNDDDSDNGSEADDASENGSTGTDTDTADNFRP